MDAVGHAGQVLVLLDRGLDHEDDFAAGHVVVLPLEGRADHRQVAQTGYRGPTDRRVFLEQAAEDDGLARLDDHVGDQLLRGGVRNDEPAHEAGAAVRHTRTKLHADEVVVADERTQGQLRTHVEELDGLRVGGFGRGGGQVAQAFTDEQVDLLPVEHEHLRLRQHGRVGHGIQGTDKDRRVRPQHAEFDAVLSLCDVARGRRHGTAGVEVTVGPGPGDQVVDRTQRGGEVGQVQVGEHREVNTKSVGLGQAGLEDGGLDQHLLRTGVQLFDHREDLLDVFRVIADDQRVLMRGLVRPAVGQGRLEPVFTLAGQRDGPVAGKQRADKRRSVGGVDVVQANDLVRQLAVLFFELSQFIRRVDVDELPFFAVTETVSVKDGVQCLVEVHAVEVGRDGPGDVSAGDDVALALDAQQLQYLGQVQILDVQVDLPERADLDLLALRQGFILGGCLEQRGGGVGRDRFAGKRRDVLACAECRAVTDAPYGAKKNAQPILRVSRNHARLLDKPPRPRLSHLQPDDQAILGQ